MFKMIEITRFQQDKVIINAELIETLEARPDTIITMTTGKKLLVEESIPEVIKKIIEYRQIIRPIIKTNAPVDDIDYGRIGQKVDVFEDE